MMLRALAVPAVALVAARWHLREPAGSLCAGGWGREDACACFKARAPTDQLVAGGRDELRAALTKLGFKSITSRAFDDVPARAPSGPRAARRHRAAAGTGRAGALRAGSSLL